MYRKLLSFSAPKPFGLLASADDFTKAILRGRLDVDLPSSSRIVRVYIGGADEGTQHMTFTKISRDLLTKIKQFVMLSSVRIFEMITDHIPHLSSRYNNCCNDLSSLGGDQG